MLRFFSCCKNENFHLQNSDIFLIFAQNIDWAQVRTALPSKNGAKIRKIGIPVGNPCKPQFFYIIVGYKGVNISWTCFPDECWIILSRL